MPKYKQVKISEASVTLAHDFGLILKQCLQTYQINQLRIYVSNPGVFEISKDAVKSSPSKFIFFSATPDEQNIIFAYFRAICTDLFNNCRQRNLNIYDQIYLPGFYNIITELSSGKRVEFQFVNVLPKPSANFEVFVDITDPNQEIYPLVYSDDYHDHATMFEIFMDQHLIFIPELKTKLLTLIPLLRVNNQVGLSHRKRKINELVDVLNFVIKATQTSNKKLSAETALVLRSFFNDTDFQMKSLYSVLHNAIGADKFAVLLKEAELKPSIQLQQVINLEQGIERVEHRINLAQELVQRHESAHSKSLEEIKNRTQESISHVENEQVGDLTYWKESSSKLEVTEALSKSVLSLKEDFAQAISDALEIKPNQVQLKLLVTMMPEDLTESKVQSAKVLLKTWVKDLHQLEDTTDKEIWQNWFLVHHYQEDRTVLSALLEQLLEIVQNIELPIEHQQTFINNLDRFFKALNNEKFTSAWKNEDLKLNHLIEIWNKTKLQFSNKTKNTKKIHKEQTKVIIQNFREHSKSELPVIIRNYFLVHAKLMPNQLDLITALSPIFEPGFKSALKKADDEGQKKLVSEQVKLALVDLDESGIFCLTPDEQKNELIKTSILGELLRSATTIPSGISIPQQTHRLILDHFNQNPPSFEVKDVPEKIEVISAEAVLYRRAVCLAMRRNLTPAALRTGVLPKNLSIEEYDDFYKVFPSEEQRRIDQAAQLINLDTHFNHSLHAYHITKIIISLGEKITELHDENMMRAKLLNAYRMGLFLVGNILIGNGKEYTDYNIVCELISLLVKVKKLYEYSFINYKAEIIVPTIDRFIELLKPDSSFLYRIVMGTRAILHTSNLFVRAFALLNDDTELRQAAILGHYHPTAKGLLELQFEFPPDSEVELELGKYASLDRQDTVEKGHCYEEAKNLTEGVYRELNTVFESYGDFFYEWIKLIANLQFQIRNYKPSEAQRSNEKIIEAFRNIFLKSSELNLSYKRKMISPLETVYIHFLYCDKSLPLDESTKHFAQNFKALSVTRALLGLPPQADLASLFVDETKQNEMVSKLIKAMIEKNPFNLEVEDSKNLALHYRICIGILNVLAQTVYDQPKLYKGLALFIESIRETLDELDSVHLRFATIERIMSLNLMEPHHLNDDKFCYNAMYNYVTKLMSENSNDLVKKFSEFVSCVKTQYFEYLRDKESTKCYLKSIISMYNLMVTNEIPEEERKKLHMTTLLKEMNLLKPSGLVSLKGFGVNNDLCEDKDLLKYTNELLSTSLRYIEGESSKHSSMAQSRRNQKRA